MFINLVLKRPRRKKSVIMYQKVSEAVAVIVLFASHKWKDWIVVGWERQITVYKLEKCDGDVG